MPPFDAPLRLLTTAARPTPSCASQPRRRSSDPSRNIDASRLVPHPLRRLLRHFARQFRRAPAPRGHFPSRAVQTLAYINRHRGGCPGVLPGPAPTSCGAPALRLLAGMARSALLCRPLLVGAHSHVIGSYRRHRTTTSSVDTGGLGAAHGSALTTHAPFPRRGTCRLLFAGGRCHCARIGRAVSRVALYGFSRGVHESVCTWRRLDGPHCEREST